MPLNIPGFAPIRSSVKHIDGTYTVYVTPPKLSGFPSVPRSVHLTEAQFWTYRRWLDSGQSIQEAFPELSADDREVLLSGLPPEAFK